MIFIAHHLLALSIIAGAGWLIGDPSARPWAKCRGPCGGSGRGFGSGASAWNNWCVCGGSGKRLRLLAHLTRRDLVRQMKKKGK